MAEFLQLRLQVGQSSTDSSDFLLIITTPGLIEGF